MGPDVCVIGFDIQMEVLENTAAFLRSKVDEVQVYGDGSLPVFTEHWIHLNHRPF
jgi:hypothetical protein